MSNARRRRSGGRVVSGGSGRAMRRDCSKNRKLRPRTCQNWKHAGSRIITVTYSSTLLHPHVTRHVLVLLTANVINTRGKDVIWQIKLLLSVKMEDIVTSFHSRYVISPIYLN